MENFGEIIEAIVTDENQDNYFAQFNGITYKIPKASITEQLDKDEVVEGIIYTDRSGDNILQMDLPDIRPNIYGWGEVIQVNYKLGLFVDVGLFNKDVVVSLDDLPLETEYWPRDGDRLYLTYSTDDKGRFWGHIASNEEILELIQRAPERLMNQTLKVTVYQVLMEGVKAISEENFDVFVHETEMTKPLRLGEQFEARVVHVHRDGRLNASMKQRAHEVLDDDAEMIYLMLSKAPDNFLPYHDKSDPERIRETFGLSKSQFKRAVGRLMKEKRAAQTKNEGIYLIKD